MRELIYYVATTLDGFIAHEDGSLDGFGWDDEYGADLLQSYPETFPAHLRGGEFSKADNRLFDAVLMGRKTYQVGLLEGVTCPYPTLDQYVFSRSLTSSPDKQVNLVCQNAVGAVRSLKQQAGKAIWLCGGADLASTLFAQGLIEKLIIKLNPVLFGAGIPLFAAGIQQTVLELTGSKVYKSGHAVLHYRVKK